MENIANNELITNNGFMGVGDNNWSVSCHNRKFKMNNNGIKLIAESYENLAKVIFDLDKNTIEVIVSSPTLSEKAPRIVDLSDTPSFFEDVRNNLEEILLSPNGKCGVDFKSVISNKDRTIFEVE